MEILHLTLKKKWFDMIESGEKPEEYRELKYYWATRLLYKIPVMKGWWWAWSGIEKGDYEGKGWEEFTHGAPMFKEFDLVRFRNGYGKEVPQMDIEFKGIEIRKGNPEWGAEEDKVYFTILLGDILKSSEFDLHPDLPTENYSYPII